MATHSNRSPSPLSSRPRNSETNSAPRRSFSGSSPAVAKPWVHTNPRRFDPFTPANSPSDFGRGRSVGKEGNDEKENDEKDHTLKFSKLQSAPKGSKSFMAPTISAASKFSPSPRKKVLVERNDPVRTSISLSDGKAMFLARSSTEELEKNDGSVELNVQESKPLKRVTFLDIPSDSQPESESVITDSNSNVEPMENEISYSSKSPSLPPYDPKTNYLSPRPQFLHYKPNPRIGILLSKENMLETELMSENFSDSEWTENSLFEEESQEVEDEVEFPVLASVSADMVIGMDEEAEEAVLLDSEPLPVSSVEETTAVVVTEEDLVEEKGKKPWGMKRLLCFSMVLMFIVACVSITITHSPAFDQFDFKELGISDVSNFYHQSGLSTSARLKFDKLMRRVNEFSVDCVSFVSKIAKGVGGEGGEVGTLRFMNLSELIQENPWNRKEELIVEDVRDEDDSIVFELEDEEEEVALDENFEMAEENDDDNYLEAEEEGSKGDFDEELVETTQVVEAETSESFDHQLAVIPPPVEDVDDTTETAANMDRIVADHEAAAVEVIDSATETNMDRLVVVDHEEASVAEVVDGTTETLDKLVVDHESAESRPTTTTENKYLVHYAMGAASSIIAAMLAVLAYQYKKTKTTTPIPNIVVLEDHPLLSEKQLLTGKEKPYSGKLQEEEDENEDEEGSGESSACPSEMSSFGSKKDKRGNEVESKTRRTRRESLASSSSEYTHSPSYGSFTTYERIPIKNGEEEVIITPVRRSSRIRNHQPREE